MIVVGSVNVDLVARGERLPAVGETITGSTFSRRHGGKGGNQAVAAARLGASAAFIGAIGDDPFGEEARSELAAEGIDLSQLQLIPGATGVALILTDAQGENLISVASGANAAMTPERVAAALAALRLRAGEVILVGHEIPTYAARAALAAGHAAGATTILNPAPATGLDRSTFGLADVLTPNRGELAILLGAEERRIGRAAHGGSRPETGAARLLQSNSEGGGVRQAVIVTLGAAGAVLVRQAGEPVDVAAPPVAAVDTVGAGDALNGALAAGLASGLDLESAARRAVAAAALSTTREGAREGLPTADELAAAVASPRPGAAPS